MSETITNAPVSPPATLFSKLAIWGFVLAFLAPLVGIFLSHSALPAIGRGERRGRSLAVWGLALSYTFVALYPVFVLLILWFGWALLATVFTASGAFLSPIAFYASMF
jgi:hypothetical protein